MFLRSEALEAGLGRLITPHTEFLMSPYDGPFSDSGSVCANRWNRVLSGHCLQRQNISTDPHLYPVCQMKRKETRQGIKACRCHIRAGSWPIMSLWSGCETHGTLQKPSIYFRVRLKLISTALKGSADLIDYPEQHYNLNCTPVCH